MSENIEYYTPLDGNEDLVCVESGMAGRVYVSGHAYVTQPADAELALNIMLATGREPAKWVKTSSLANLATDILERDALNNLYLARRIRDADAAKVAEAERLAAEEAAHEAEVLELAKVLGKVAFPSDEWDRIWKAHQELLIRNARAALAHLKDKVVPE